LLLYLDAFDSLLNIFRVTLLSLQRPLSNKNGFFSFAVTPCLYYRWKYGFVGQGFHKFGDAGKELKSLLNCKYKNKCNSLYLTNVGYPNHIKFFFLWTSITFASSFPFFIISLRRLIFFCVLDTMKRRWSFHRRTSPLIPTIYTPNRQTLKITKKWKWKY
jgi:hypothetical protein